MAASIYVAGDYGVHWSMCNLPVFKSAYTYKASECKRAIKRLHCATSKSSLWYMGCAPRGGAFERPRIYRTSLIVQDRYTHSPRSFVECANLKHAFHSSPLFSMIKHFFLQLLLPCPLPIIWRVQSASSQWYVIWRVSIIVEELLPLIKD